LTDTCRKLRFIEFVNTSSHCNARPPCGQGTVCDPARGKLCSSRNWVKAFCAASNAKVLSCKARLLAVMMPVARSAAAIATAMMASATSTSIRVKPRWRWGC
jgi:hypothetical protein